MRSEQSRGATYGAEPQVVFEPAGRPRLSIPLAIRCGLMISFVKLLLKLRGYAGTIAWIRRRVENVALRDSTCRDTIRRVEYAVAMAGALYPARAMCLEQSLTLYYLLRREGILVGYCQGAVPYPFESHAWVEYRGEPVNDVAEHVKLFAKLPALLP